MSMGSFTVFENISWILFVISARLQLCTCLGQSSLWLKGIGSPNVCPNDAIRQAHVPSAIKCGVLCSKETGCTSFTYVNTTTPNCYLMSVDPYKLTTCNNEPNAKHFKTFTCPSNDLDYETYSLSDGSYFSYRIVHALKDAARAWDDCFASEGSLLKVSTIEKLKFMQDFLLSCEGNYTNQFYFIDGNNVDVNDVWTWTGGEHINMNKTYWNVDQPDNPTSQHCVVMNSDSDWRFHDAHCTSMFYYICEKELVL